MIGALRYEWRRISSVRATWILSGVCLLVVVGLSLLTVLALSEAGQTAVPDSGGPLSPGQPSDPGEPSAPVIPTPVIPLAELVGQLAGNFIVLVLLGTIAAQVFGQEYRHGTIRLTLTAFPRRTQIFAAKLAVSLAVISAVFAVCLVAATGIVLLKPDWIDTSASGLSSAGFLARQWLDLIGFCLIVFGITLLTRVLALGIIIPLLLAVVFEPLITTLLNSWLPWLAKVLPFSSASAFVSGDSMLRNGLVFAAWVVAVLAAGFTLFKIRDA